MSVILIQKQISQILHILI